MNVAVTGYLVVTSAFILSYMISSAGRRWSRLDFQHALFFTIYTAYVVVYALSTQHCSVVWWQAAILGVANTIELYIIYSHDNLRWRWRRLAPDYAKRERRKDNH